MTAVALPLAGDPAAAIAVIDRLGWRRVPVGTARAGGDRVLAAWDALDGAAELIHDGLGVILHLREGCYAAAASLQRVLAVRSSTDLAADLASRDPVTAARAMRAAVATGDVQLVEPLLAATRSDDAALAGEAQDALAAMVPELAQTGLAALGKAAQRSGRDPLFSVAIPVRWRRQWIRRLAARSDPASPAELTTLAAAFADPDPEVRAAAAIATVRRRAIPLAAALKKWQPEDRGWACEDRLVLRALRDVALAELGGLGQPSPPPGPDGERRAGLYLHLAACITGNLTERRDRAWLLIRSLSEPLSSFLGSDSSGESTPGPAPDWCPIPAIEHWLGDDGSGAQAIRAVIPTTVKIARTPIAEGDGVWHVDAATAAERATRNGTAIPDPDTWECAARGPDGRRFPWGNGPDPDWRHAPSPCGCTGWGAWEWTRDGDGWWLMGGPPPSPVWHRRRPQPGEKAAVRLLQSQDPGSSPR